MLYILTTKTCTNLNVQEVRKTRILNGQVHDMSV